MENQQNYNPGTQSKLANDPLTLILSICAVTLCCGPLGLILSILSFSMSNKSIQDYVANPSMYQDASHSNVKLAKTISLVGIILNIIACIALVAYWGWFITAIGGAAAAESISQ